ncbi:hypothetical protein SAMN05216259_102274 [Actinacidiphila guanduensis]|uniref:Uncharacterized protein n=1 Tax=Actinacidiphila guanduensis TaxID=310781 RepID=A0A1G9XUH5_9ACTN|nr:hypothetical protein SAMN05216259_102274 [Actinacidiphila guanduensis]
MLTSIGSGILELLGQEGIAPMCVIASS